MSSPYSHSSHPVLLSDSDRSRAMETLGRAYAEGRLTLDEYEDRCDQVTQARFHADLSPLFTDLPAYPASPASSRAPQPAAARLPLPDTQYFSAEEIEHTRKQGRNMRDGVMSLTVILGLIGMMYFDAAAESTFLSALCVFLIPVVAILLYVMKVGPASWHQPSPKKLQKQRLLELRRAQALENADIIARQEAERAQQRARRQQLTGELTNDALDLARRGMRKFHK